MKLGNNAKVLVTDITSYKAIVVARYLKKFYPKITIIATDHRPISKFLHTRFVDDIYVLECSSVKGIVYVEALSKILSQTKADLLIPINSSEIRVLIEHRELLGPSFSYMGDSRHYSILDNKQSFSEILNLLNLPHPKTYSTLDAPLPLVLKPRHGSSSNGVMYIRNTQALNKAHRLFSNKIHNYIIQDLVKGEGVGYSGYFEKGKILVGYAHRRVAEYPISGGSSVVRERYPYDDEALLKSLVEKVLDDVPWTGFAMFEFKRIGKNSFSFIECNPRIWGSIHQGLISGVNYFAPLLGNSNYCQIKEFRTELFPLSYIAVFKYFFSGRTSILFDFVKGWFRTRVDVNPFYDPLGFLSLISHKI